MKSGFSTLLLLILALSATARAAPDECGVLFRDTASFSKNFMEPNVARTPEGRQMVDYVAGENRRIRAFLGDLPKKLGSLLRSLFRNQTPNSIEMGANSAYTFFKDRDWNEGRDVLVAVDSQDRRIRVADFNSLPGMEFADRQYEIASAELSPGGDWIAVNLSFRGMTDRRSIILVDAKTLEVLPYRNHNVSIETEWIKTPWGDRLSFYQDGNQLLDPAKQALLSREEVTRFNGMKVLDSEVFLQGTGMLALYKPGDHLIQHLKFQNAKGDLVPAHHDSSRDFDYVGRSDDRFFFFQTISHADGEVCWVKKEDSSRGVITSAWKSDGTRFLKRALVRKTRLFLITRDLEGKEHIEIRDLDGKLLHEMPWTREEFVTDVRLGPGRLIVKSHNVVDKIETTVSLDDLTPRWSTVTQSSLGLEPEEIGVRTIAVPASDGRTIMTYVIGKKDALAKGNAPTHLDFYGAWGVNHEVLFQPGMAPFIAEGGLVVTAQIRGGAEQGANWHQEGMKGRKTRSSMDVVEVARYLKEHHITHPQKLAISGGSSGGHVAALAMNMDPSLFDVVIPRVGLYDMELKNDLDADHNGFKGEYGSYDEETLLEVSPQHSIRSGAHYPLTLIQTSTHDTRVNPIHSFNFASSLQAQVENPSDIYLRVLPKQGHSPSLREDRRVESYATPLAFMYQAFGMGNRIDELTASYPEDQSHRPAPTTDRISGDGQAETHQGR